MAGREDFFQRSMNEGHSAAWDQDWERAAKAYQTALTEFPENAKALNAYALALHQLSRYDEALKTYIRVARVSPEDPIPFEKIAQLNERLGNLKDATLAAMQAAELYLKTREVDKAIENWLRVVQLNPENVNARSRLALIHEKMGQINQALAEYLALASILQNGGNVQKALEILGHAGKLNPNSTEVKQAIALIGAGKMLPKPMRPRGGTGPLRMAAVKELSAPKEQVRESPDPVNEGRQRALKTMAEVLFDLSDESSEAQARRGLAAIMKNTGQLSPQAEQTKILLHLSQAIDAQTRNEDALAADEIERAVENGFNHPAAYFTLGLLRAKTPNKENAMRNIQQCYKHTDYALAGRLLGGQILRSGNKMKEAAIEYLEALKIADAEVVQAEQAEAIRQLYEPLIESLQRENDLQAFAKLCENVEKMLMRVNWRQHLLKMRDELPKSEDGNQALPLADVIIQAQSSQVIETMNYVNQLARANRLRSAMDEAFHALTYAPTYLPLHILIGDLLIREGRTPEAITKFTTVANAYSIRGEGSQATSLLKRIIQISPMDLAARTRLIDQLTARGQINEAISEYMDLADIYYRLAELDMARKAYTTALRLSQQPNANRSWSVQILHRMADIDMQRLDWRQAIRVYEQIRTLKPDDAQVRENLIALNLRMGQTQQAKAEVESFVGYLENNSRAEESITFLEHLMEEHPDHVILRRTLAQQLYKAGQTAQAIAQLDAAGDKLMETGDKEGVAEIINQIIAMNPPNLDEYRNLLLQIKNS